MPASVANPQSSSGSTVSSSASITLGHSISSTSQGSKATTTPVTYTYSLDRFRQQDAHDDGTIYGRTSNQAYPSRANTRAVYKARADSAIATFNAAFHGAASRGTGGDV